MAKAIQGSNSIEGFKATLDDAAAVEVGEQPLDADEETRLALEGYRNAMTYVLQVAAETDFSYSVQLLKSLHFMMTAYDLKNRPGRWRSGAIYVSKESSGEVVYEGPDVEEVPVLMDQLVRQLNAKDDTPTMVRAAMAHLNLVMVHPFRDGNGRMARCLQTLVLAREGVLAPVFSSVEEYLGADTQAYYDVLEVVGAGQWQPDRDALPWVRFILTAHLRQARTVLRRVKETERLWDELEKIAERHSLPERVISALHSVDYAAIGLADYGKPGNYFARQIERWSKQYKLSETESIPAMDNLIEWLPKHVPQEAEEIAAVAREPGEPEQPQGRAAEERLREPHAAVDRERDSRRPEHRVERSAPAVEGRADERDLLRRRAGAHRRSRGRARRHHPEWRQLRLRRARSG